MLLRRLNTRSDFHIVSAVFWMCARMTRHTQRHRKREPGHMACSNIAGAPHTCPREPVSARAPESTTILCPKLLKCMQQTIGRGVLKCRPRLTVRAFALSRRVHVTAITILSCAACRVWTLLSYVPPPARPCCSLLGAAAGCLRSFLPPAVALSASPTHHRRRRCLPFTVPAAITLKEPYAVDNTIVYMSLRPQIIRGRSHASAMALCRVCSALPRCSLPLPSSSGALSRRPLRSRTGDRE